MTEQRRANGSLRHLLTLEGLSRDELEMLLERAQHFVRPRGAHSPRSNVLAGLTVANLFTEPSTRTRVSFELAAKRLGADVVNLERQLSSRVKGESMLDTVFTLESLQVDVFVVRDAEAGVPALVADHVGANVSVLSAGEAHVSHPTQGLLDALTILQHKKRCDGLTVAIVGDILHSRVARSAFHALTTLGVGELRIVAPPALMPPAGRLRLAKPDAIVMHPQPMNRGVEIDSAVADGPRSVIRDQVANGVAVRMAVLETLAARPMTGWSP
jgi:aspartate carbamoyltransferase catalytic subunit